MSRLSIINLAELPKPMNVIDVIDSEAIINARMDDFKARWAAHDPPAAAQYDVEGLEFDPIKIQHECSAFFETLLRDRVNQAARAVTLAFATGTDLDAIATRFPGGVPRLTSEQDERYRRRILLSPNTLSPHGSEEAYVFWALTGDPTVYDASAITPIPASGRVIVTIVGPNIPVFATNITPGKMVISITATPTPTLEQIGVVRDYIYANSRKGLTDDVSVLAPKVITKQYRIRVWLFPNVSEALALNAMGDALRTLISDQYGLGVDHSRMAIDAAVAQPGVHHAEIDEPERDVMADPTEIVNVGSITVTVIGRME